MPRTVTGRTVLYMPPESPDLDEKFSLPQSGEEVLKRLFDDEPTDDFQDDEPDAPEDDAT